VSLGSLFAHSHAFSQIPLQLRCCDRILGAGLITTWSQVRVVGAILPRTSARRARNRFPQVPMPHPTCKALRFIGFKPLTICLF
jgi:hypothetical protein